MIDGLIHATDYFFNVRGIDSDGTLSRESEMIKVTTLTDSSVDDALSDDDPVVVVLPDGSVSIAGQVVPAEVYDRLGRRVQPSNLPRGIYLIKVGNKTVKLVI